MAKYTNDELLEAFGEMTLVELSEFVKAFEEKFDVEAAAPAAVAVAAPGELLPPQRGVNAPKAVLEKAKKEDAEKAKAQLEEAGASVELK